MPRSLIVGSFTPSVILDLARTLGHLEDRDLAVTEVSVASSPGQFAALLAGELDIALTSPDNVLAYRFSPSNPLGAVADVRIVGAVDRGMGLGLYAGPGVTDPEQLRGATVGVDVSTSGFALAMYALAESVGVQRAEYTLVALGSTPKRLVALLAGECDATMLNAGNELVAEQRGCSALARVRDVCPPYLGTVIGVAGETHLEDARRLDAALREVTRAVLAGGLDDEAAASAAKVLDLDADLAARYVTRLRSPSEGLVDDERVDRAALGTLVGLRRRYLPELINGTDGTDGADVWEHALEDSSGLVAAPA